MAEGDAVLHNVEGGIRQPARVFISWGVGNRLHLSYVGAEGQGGSVSEVGLGQEWTAQQRRIAYESLPVFALLQNQRQQLKNSDWWENVLEYSRSISSILETSSQGPSTLKAAWELIELFYVDKSAASCLPERLVDWLASYDRILENSINSTLVSVQQELPSIQFPEDEQAYWDAMVSALSVGWLDVAVSFLRIHGSYQLDQLKDRQTENGLVEAVTLLITKMPRLRPRLPDGAPGVAISFKPDFSKAWEKWRNQVSRLENSVFWAECTHRGTLRGLKKVLQVLLGNVNVLTQSTSHWMELLVAHFLYAMPFTMVSEGLRGLADKCKQLKGSGDDDFSELVLSVMSNDTEKVLAKCSNVFDSWMMAHVGDLLVAKGTDAHMLLEEEREAIGGLSLRELHRLVYSQVLSSHSQTWQLAPVYLASCPKQGLGMLEAILLGQGHRNPKKALEICRLYELDTLGTALERAAGMQNLKHGKQGPAIVWLQCARDEFKLLSIAENYIRTITSGEADQLDNLEYIEGLFDFGTAKYGVLSFLARYKTFKASIQNIRDQRRDTASGRAAVASLLQLLKSGAFPGVWMSLFEDSLDLIEWPEHALVTESETSALLCCLEELYVEPGGNTIQAVDRGAVDRIRLSLARNLGRAILQST